MMDNLLSIKSINKIVSLFIIIVQLFMLQSIHDYRQNFVFSVDNFQRNIPEFLWEKTYGGTGEDRGIQSIFLQDSQTVLTAGTTIDVGFLNTGIYILKTSIDGSIIWERNHGLLSNNDTIGMVLNKNNEIILCANSRQIEKGESSPNYITLYHTDHRGLLKKEKILDDFPRHYASNFIMIDDGSLIITGSVFDEDQPEDEIFLMQLSAEFEILWKQKLAKGWMVTTHDILETYDEKLLILSTTHVGGGQLRIKLQKINKNGRIIWSRIYGDKKNYMGCSIIYTSDHQYLIMGETDAYDDQVGIVLIKIDQNGDKIWERFFQKHGNTIGRSIVETCNHGFLIAGSTNITIDDMLYYAGNANGYLLFVDSFGSKI